MSPQPPKSQDEIDVFRRGRGSMAVTWFHRLPKESNHWCLYCGAYVGPGSVTPSNLEHLIARNMVPPGSFRDASAFNFLFRACVDCNTKKSRIEDHISAATLLGSAARRTDPAIDALAIRKARKSYHPSYPGRTLADLSRGLRLSFGKALTMTLRPSALPDRQSLITLAHRHVQALFSLATSADPRVQERTRLLPRNHWGIFGAWQHEDWGDPRLVEISRRARVIPSVIDVVTADGFFKIALRRGDQGEPWFWALEWNKSVRLVGWIGEAETPPPFFLNLPVVRLPGLPAFGSRQRSADLSADDDHLFDPLDDSSEQESPPADWPSPS